MRRVAYVVAGLMALSGNVFAGNLEKEFYASNRILDQEKLVGVCYDLAENDTLVQAAICATGLELKDKEEFVDYLNRMGKKGEADWLWKDVEIDRMLEEMKASRNLF